MRERKEDIEPNLDFELQRQDAEDSRAITFNKEARRGYLSFAVSPEAQWNANFRDLGTSVARMSTLATGGRIDEDTVIHEIARLRAQWDSRDDTEQFAVLAQVLKPDAFAQIDVFDRAQLASVLEVCRNSASTSAAGRTLFSVSRQAKASSNDTDRLRKYLGRFGLSWSDTQTAA